MNLETNLSVPEVDKHLLSMSESGGIPSYPGNFIDFIGLVPMIFWISQNHNYSNLTQWYVLL
jgi:hypothetical protein